MFLQHEGSFFLTIQLKVQINEFREICSLICSYFAYLLVDELYLLNPPEKPERVASTQKRATKPRTLPLSFLVKILHLSSCSHISWEAAAIHLCAFQAEMCTWGWGQGSVETHIQPCSRKRKRMRKGRMGDVIFQKSKKKSYQGSHRGVVVFGGCLGAGSRRELLGSAGQSLTAWIPKYTNPILLHIPYRPQMLSETSSEMQKKSL